MAGIHKMLVRIANRENPDQAVWYVYALFVQAILAGNISVQNFRTSTILHDIGRDQTWFSMH